MLKVNLRGGDLETPLDIQSNGAIPTMPHTFPVQDKVDTTLLFRANFGLTTNTAITDMRINGTTDNQKFSIPAEKDDDIYITIVSFLIADANATLNKFGNLTALTNGCSFQYETTRGTSTIAPALKSNFDFVRLCVGQPAFGDAATAFRAGNVSSTSEGYLPVFDMRIFGFPFGIRLRAGTNQAISMTVKDDTTGVDAFDAIGYGFRRLKGT